MHLPVPSIFGLLMNKVRQKFKGNVGCSIFYFSIFCVIIFSLNGWLIQGSNISKKNMIGLPCNSCFLQCLYLCSTFQASSGSNKMWPLRATSTIAYSFCKLNRFTFYFYGSLTEQPHILSPLEFCSHGTSWVLYANGVTRNRE